MKHDFSNRAAVVEAIRNAAQRLRPDWKEPEDRAREHLAAAAELYQETGDLEAFKRTKRLLARLTPEDPK